MKVEIRNINGRLGRFESRFDLLEQLVTVSFECVRRHFDTYQDVQVLKERMARMEGERNPNPAA